jgi:hypothetical protein
MGCRQALRALFNRIAVRGIDVADSRDVVSTGIIGSVEKVCPSLSGADKS